MRSRALPLSVVTFVVIAMFATQLPAGINRWTNTGPEGGGVIKLVADRSNAAIFYAATTAGVFKTENGGVSWRLITASLSGRGVSAMLIRQGDRATLFVQPYGGPLYRTRDGGQTWVAAAQFAQPSAFLILHGEHTLFTWQEGTLMRSDDDGDTWRDVPQNFRLWNLVSVGGNLYTLDATGTVSVSSDGGASWKPILVPTASVRPVSLAVDEDQQRLIVITADGLVTTYARQTDWQTLPSGPVHVIAVTSYDGGLIATTMAGVFRLPIGAKAWEAVGYLAGSLTAVAASGPDHILVDRVESASLYVWTAEADHWVTAMKGIKILPTNDVAVSDSGVYAATTYGLYHRAGDSEAWQSINLQSKRGDSVTSVTLAGGDVVLASSYSIHRSEDAGVTWNAVTPDYEYTSAVGVAPSDPKTIYAALTSSLAASVDGGKTWNYVQNDIPNGFYFAFYGFTASQIVVDPTTPTTVYMSTDRTLKSVDGGTHWTTIFRYMTSIAIDRFNPSLLYGASDGETWRSTDAGATWQLLNLPDRVYALAVDPSRASVVYAGTDNGKVYRSTDGGLRWTVTLLGLNTSINKLAVDRTGKRVYAATSAGLYEYEHDTTYLREAVTHRVSLRTYYGNFVSAEGCGDAGVNANATSAGPCETFTLYDVDGGTLLDGDRIYLQAANNSFVAAEGGANGPLNANRLVASSWETFTIHMIGQGGDATIGNGAAISLKSSGGDYVAAENGGRNGCACDSGLNANRRAANAWETFTIIK